MAEVFAQRGCMIGINVRVRAGAGNRNIRKTCAERGSDMAYSRLAGPPTSIRSTRQAAGLLTNARIIYDSNFNSLGTAKAKVELAIASGSTAVVIFVHRHPVESYLQGVLPRALEEGRTVSITAHLRMHRDSLKTFLRVQRAFAENPRAAFTVLNNTGHATEAFPADISYLQGVKYDQEEIFKAIKEGLDHAYRQGKISQDLYEASCGDT